MPQEVPLARHIRNQEGIGSKIIEHLDTLNSELSPEVLRKQSLSDRLYWEEVQLRENETLAALHSKLVNSGLIPKKKVAPKKVVHNSKKQAVIAARSQPKRAKNSIKVEAKPTAQTQLLSQYKDVNLMLLIEEAEPLEEKMATPAPIVKPIQRPSPRIITPEKVAAPAPAPAPAIASPPSAPAEPSATEKRLAALIAASPPVVEESPAPEPEPEEDEQVVDEIGAKEREQEAAFYAIAERHGIDREIVEDWKRQYGQSGIFAMILTEEELYIMTYLRNSEYKEIMKVVRKISDQEKAEDEYNRLVLGTALLYPETGGSMEMFADRRAGTVAALVENIRMRSGLTLDPAQVRALTVVL